MSTKDKFNESQRSANEPSVDPALDPSDIALERAWKEASDQLPSMGLDSAILTRAREEVAAPARRRSFLSRILPGAWVAPLATASVALLVVGVSTDLLKQNDAPNPMEQFDESELAVSARQISKVPRAAASEASQYVGRSAESASETSVDTKTTANAASDSIIVAFDESTVVSAAAGASAPAVSDVRSLTTDSTPRKVYQKPALKRRAAAAPAERRKATRIDDDAIENPLIARINSARALDGRFLDDRLSELFSTDEEWFGMLRALVSRGHAELATELAGKFRLLRSTSQTPEDLASLFAKAADQAKASQSLN